MYNEHYSVLKKNNIKDKMEISVSNMKSPISHLR